MLLYRKKKLLVLRLKDPERVTSIIPKSKVFEHNGKQFVAVKHGIDEVKVLRNIGIEVPSPINYYYDWPGRFKPFKHQEHTASFLTLNHRAFNLNDLGTGKTISTLWAYDYLREQGLVKKVVVITPLSTLERTWADEVFQHFPHLTTSVLYGSREKRLKMLNIDADIYLINHDGIKIKGMVEALNARPDIDLVIVDELAQVARTAGTDRYKALQKIINKGEFPRKCWGLSGLPIPNGPMDAWAQCRLLVPERIPPYANRFKESVMRQVSQYVWIPKPNALEIVQEAMQPAIRYHRDECIDLPPCIYETRTVELTPPQKLAYKEMLAQLTTQIEGGQVTAVNEAVKAQKLIQIACIGYNTPVLTELGWVPIQEVPGNVRVWDGVEWVSHKGLVFKGTAKTIEVDGVSMTPEHEVLTIGGWKPAQEIINGKPSQKLDRVEIRLPDGYGPCRFDPWQRPVCSMVMPVRLWEHGHSEKPVSPHHTQNDTSKLWMPPRERNTQADKASDVQYLGQDETALSKPIRQRLEKLRGAWNNCVRTVGSVVREFLGGYGFDVPGRIFTGSSGQQWAVLSGELPMVHNKGTGKQPPNKHNAGNSSGEYDSSGSCGVLWIEAHNDVRSNISIWLDSGKSVLNSSELAVFDLVNCGPRNRFVVQGVNGEHLIVHNCGVVYGKDGQSLELDSMPRLEVVKETIEESATKVIVFVPFVAVVEHVTAYLRKFFTVECIHRNVSKNERDRIFSDFQRTPNPKVLVASPATMSHGLTLTEASTIIWFGPIASNDIFEQANGRITRPGQKHTQLIMMIEGTDVERKYYKRLKEKQKVQGTLLEMVKSDRESSSV